VQIKIAFIWLFTLAAVVLGAINCKRIRKNCYSTAPKESDFLVVPDFPKEDESMLWAVLVLVFVSNIYAFCFSAYFMCKTDKCRCTCRCNWFIVLAVLNIVVAVITVLIEIVAAAIVLDDCDPQDITVFILTYNDESSTSVLLILALCLTSLTAIFTTILEYKIDKLL